MARPSDTLINYALNFSATVYSPAAKPSSDSKASRLMVQLAVELPHYGVLESPKKTYFRIHHGAKVFPAAKVEKGELPGFLASWPIIEAHRRLVYNAVISIAILWLRVLQNFMDSSCFLWHFHLQHFCTISERETLNCVFGACWMWDNSKGKPTYLITSSWHKNASTLIGLDLKIWHLSRGFIRIVPAISAAPIRRYTVAKLGENSTF